MRTRHGRTTRILISTLASVVLLAAACGSDDEGPQDTAAPTTEAEAEAEAEADPEAEAEAEADPEADAATASEPEPGAPGSDAPTRVVSLSPTATEMMFAIGAGELLVAVDEFSNFPDAALELPNELSGFEPNIEAIAAFEPDLVLIGGDFTGLGDQLAQIDIESLDLPAANSFDDTFGQIEQLGAITGNADAAADVVAQMQTDIDAIVERAAAAGAGLSFYHELDPSYFSADSSTFIGAVYALLNLTNIADGDDSESFGFPQLNVEFIIDANPDLIFLADTKCCAETAATVAERPGWDVIAAVQNGNVIEMDDDVASRWGPRIVDYLDQVATAVEAAA